jgi:hypothetical protein
VEKIKLELKRVKPIPKQGEPHTSVVKKDCLEIMTVEDCTVTNVGNQVSLHQNSDLVVICKNSFDRVCKWWQECHSLDNSLADRDENGKAIGGAIPKGWMYNLADTQPIRVRYTAEEIMPKRYPDEMVNKGGTYWALTNGGVWEKVGLNPLYLYEGFTWFIDIPGAPEELRPLKYPENEPEEPGKYIVHYMTATKDKNMEWFVKTWDGFSFETLFVVDWFIPYRISSLIEEK